MSVRKRKSKTYTYKEENRRFGNIRNCKFFMFIEISQICRKDKTIQLSQLPSYKRGFIAL